MVRPTLSVVPEEACVDQEAWIDGPDAGVDTDGGVVDPGVVTTLLRDTGWTVRAVCVGTEPDALFVTGAAQRDAAKICQACPVRLECLADALDNQIEYGVWGGMTERQRRAVLKKSPEVVSWRALLEEARSGAVAEAAS